MHFCSEQFLGTAFSANLHSSSGSEKVPFFTSHVRQGCQVPTKTKAPGKWNDDVRCEYFIAKARHVFRGLGVGQDHWKTLDLFQKFLKDKMFLTPKFNGVGWFTNGARFERKEQGK